MVDPFFVAIAAALAGKGVSSVYDLVKKKFSGDPKSLEALDSARQAGPESVESGRLAAELQSAAENDPRFSRELRSMWNSSSGRQRVGRDGTANQITGSVSGKVVQARDIDGDVNL